MLILSILMLMYICCFQYPLVRDNIQGEETSTFTNALGESINLEITDDSSQTVRSLLTILDGHDEAAECLAAEVHKNVVCDDANVDAIPDLVWKCYSCLNIHNIYIYNK